ncbi:RNA 2',3'-cyclic phosphodiesterase [Gracilibacillus kekensis]|uniref:RNA 2',3'-cyclic phosphodiesterase n=1 Tax=Gracilibacillus kekensis TaxID=1027249 RepID=A0A1M7NKP9_9BACI|nr:RNA 2',3'-cyclic phosphodiesterase [Gracilibacillus kekensis]SHN04307.1 2'-5' RNA ligase [Gracilibacillus kekensis]
MKDSNNHYFIAVKLDDKTKEWIHDIQKTCRDTFDFKQWVDPNDFHITMHFFGAIAQKTLTQIASDLEQITVRNSFSLEIGQLSTFGQSLKPRVLWIGVSNTPELTSLHHEVQTVIGQYVNTDKRSFTPHITLAKKWANTHTINKENINFTTKTKEIKINEIVIYEIHPDKKQKYLIWDQFKLK